MSRAWFLALAGPGGEATRATAELEAAALALAGGDPVTALVFGGDATAAERLHFGDTVRPLVIDTGADGDAVTRGHALGAVLVQARERGEAPSLVLIPTSQECGDLAGIVQAVAEVPVLANAETVEISPDGVVSIGATVFGDRLRVRQAARPGTAIVLARPGLVATQPSLRLGDAPLAVGEAAPAPGTAMAAATSGTGASAPQVVRPILEPSPVRVISRRPAVSAALEQARIIVTAGRGVAGPEGIALVADLAASLGAALGASRAAVDQGWIDYAHQVGQTGKRVNPDVYLALGVSGAAAHAAGMRRSRTVIAVNRDPEAPMADLADLYVVGDLFEIAPRLAAAVRARS